MTVCRGRLNSRLRPLQFAICIGAAARFSLLFGKNLPPSAPLTIEMGVTAWLAFRLLNLAIAKVTCWAWAIPQHTYENIFSAVLKPPSAFLLAKYWLGC